MIPFLIAGKCANKNASKKAYLAFLINLLLLNARTQEQYKLKQKMLHKVKIILII